MKMFKRFINFIVLTCIFTFSVTAYAIEMPNISSIDISSECIPTNKKDVVLDMIKRANNRDKSVLCISNVLDSNKISFGIISHTPALSCSSSADTGNTAKITYNVPTDVFSFEYNIKNKTVSNIMFETHKANTWIESNYINNNLSGFSPVNYHIDNNLKAINIVDGDVSGGDGNNYDNIPVTPPSKPNVKPTPPQNKVELPSSNSISSEYIPYNTGCANDLFGVFYELIGKAMPVCYRLMAYFFGLMLVLALIKVFINRGRTKDGGLDLPTGKPYRTTVTSSQVRTDYYK